MTVKQVYDYIDRLIPFSTQESWDNSGLLVGDPNREVHKIITALDISIPVIKEAKEAGAELIVSHHPVIFHPLKAVVGIGTNPVAMLIKNDISAICTHTPFDMSPLGMNKGLYELMKEPLGLTEEYIPLEDCRNGNMIGRIYKLKKPFSSVEMAEILSKKIFGCVRYSSLTPVTISSIAISSGAGSSFVELARERGADALISGDFKHDSFISALNLNFPLYDCGHYGTEKIFTAIMKELLKNSGVEVISSLTEKDPVMTLNGVINV